MPPTMFVVAGPSGSGKSTAFPASGFGVDFFNADDRAAALNGGSYSGISRAIRDEVNLLFEAFVVNHIERGASCAFETTLRSSITFEQAALAKRAGFSVEMRYLALETFEMHLERVKMRADRDGHSAPESLLRSIYYSSINNLPRAIREMDFIYVYDNSRWGQTPLVLLQAAKARFNFKRRTYRCGLRKRCSASRLFRMKGLSGEEMECPIKVSLDRGLRGPTRRASRVDPLVALREE